MKGTIAAIWLKRFKRGPMDPVESAELIIARGLKGNASQGGKRQITIIDEAAWFAACAQAGVELPPSHRRANVMVRGIDLRNSRGQTLRLGNCVVRIYNETRPCERMEPLREALSPEWRGGVYGEIVEGGTIHVGDDAELIA